MSPCVSWKPSAWMSWVRSVMRRLNSWDPDAREELSYLQGRATDYLNLTSCSLSSCFLLMCRWEWIWLQLEEFTITYPQNKLNVVLCGTRGLGWACLCLKETEISTKAYSCSITTPLRVNFKTMISFYIKTIHGQKKMRHQMYNINELWSSVCHVETSWPQTTPRPEFQNQLWPVLTCRTYPLMAVADVLLMLRLMRPKLSVRIPPSRIPMLSRKLSNTPTSLSGMNGRMPGT